MKRIKEMKIDDIKAGDIIEWEYNGCPSYGINVVTSLFGRTTVVSIDRLGMMPLSRLKILHVLAKEDFDKYKKKVETSE